MYIFRAISTVSSIYLRRADTHPVKYLLYASSSSVYGNNEKVPFSEDDNVDNPVSLYAATKKSNELMASAYSHLYGIPLTGLRFFTVYGPWGRPDMAVYKFTEAMMKGKPIQVYANGTLQRDFTYIDDIVNGILSVLDRQKETKAPVPDEHWQSPSRDGQHPGFVT